MLGGNYIYVEVLRNLLTCSTNLIKFFQLQISFAMTQIAISQQIEAIQKATQKALKSKEAAHKFLVDAGIIKEQPDQEIAVSSGKEKSKK